MCLHEDIRTIQVSKLPKIWMMANAFKSYFEKSKNDIVSMTGQISYQDDFAVCATCGFFACELYLKFIYASEKIPKSSHDTEIPEGHNIRKLFDSLKGKTQNALIDKFSSSKEFTDKFQFKQTIKEIGNGYNEWRYLFEARKNMDLQGRFLIDFLDVLQKHSEDIINYELPLSEDDDNIEVSMSVKINDPDLINRIIK